MKGGWGRQEKRTDVCHVPTAALHKDQNHYVLETHTK